MASAERQQHGHIFSDLDRRALKRILRTRTRYDYMLPILEQGVRAYREKPAPNFQRPEEEYLPRHADIAERIERQARRTLQTLERLSPYTLKNLANQYLWGLHDVRTTLVNLVNQANKWKGDARTKARRKRGRKGNPNRIFLAEWVGLKLAQAGIPLTVSEAGVWARTLAIVYAAAGIEVPASLFRDIRHAFEFISTTSPDLVPKHRTRT